MPIVTDEAPEEIAVLIVKSSTDETVLSSTHFLVTRSSSPDTFAS